MGRKTYSINNQPLRVQCWMFDGGLCWSDVIDQCEGDGRTDAQTPRHNMCRAIHLCVAWQKRCCFCRHPSDDWIRVNFTKSGSLSHNAASAVLFQGDKLVTATLTIHAANRAMQSDVCLSCVLYRPRVGAIDFARRPAGWSARRSEMIKDVRAMDAPACGLESATVWKNRGTTAWFL